MRQSPSPQQKRRPFRSLRGHSRYTRGQYSIDDRANSVYGFRYISGPGPRDEVPSIGSSGQNERASPDSALERRFEATPPRGRRPHYGVVVAL
ncbi:hypothetical protein EVAR_60394_1 [Eumeta japonica]|uniref:Uncharacterized protein n=1 Tax=Eumeta variegata TaxID=151549 RepID=A0A4C1YS37_EUMVA|nr:hypothetical protein EVAR_60394_1 [Eumeta japonica]